MPKETPPISPHRHFSVIDSEPTIPSSSASGAKCVLTGDLNLPIISQSASIILLSALTFLPKTAFFLNNNSSVIGGVWPCPGLYVTVVAYFVAGGDTGSLLGSVTSSST
ncbi:hypothetical protein C8F04DRAFT_1128741 [Mycena alexandri]|uniref:Uncharacterized protein n=1 Tax=Mycena alexandri TaxID=1745969 RepID=A0AAD6SH56_9AGAR|nr:hypothetical protein C8F04DRAFT_1128741 [Mycena alexandri]